VLNQRLYVATARKAVKAIDLAGRRELWSHDFGRGFQAPPRLAGGLLIVAAPHPDAEAAGLDVKTGERRWTRKVGDIAQAPLVEAPRAIFVSVGGWVRGLDTATGEQLWETHLEGFFPGGSLLKGNDLVVLSAAGTLYRLEAATGRHLASFDLGGAAAPDLVLLPNGREFAVATYAGRIRSFGFDLAPGTLDLSGPPLLRAPGVGAGILATAGKDRRLRAYALPYGDPLWERPFEVAAAAPPAVSPDGTRLALGTLAGEVWTLAAADGTPLGRAGLSGAPATPVWIDDRLAVVTDRGVLAILGAGAAAATSPAPEPPSQ
jgi:outer membrane protein assembly factor BamB